MNEFIQGLSVWALPVILAITLHEAAHAYAAKYFGDDTAYKLGRMSLNPIRHIDPIGTIALPLLLVFLSSPFIFGYAKPVPIDFSRLRNPKKQMAWVALAGPAINMVMALGFLIIGAVAQGSGVTEPYVYAVVEAGLLINVLLCVLNLLPLPPLDGGRILTSVLPHPYDARFARIEPYGFVILLVLLFTGVLGTVLQPIMAGAIFVLNLLVYPLQLLLN
jgi:Zn-dependent protease